MYERGVADRSDIWTPHVTVAAVVERDGRFLLVDEETDQGRLFNQPALYAFHAFRASGLLLHAPGAISQPREEAGQVSFTVESWLDRPYHVLVAGLKQAPQVRVNGRETPLSISREAIEREGRLVLTLEGKAAVEILTR